MGNLCKMCEMGGSGELRMRGGTLVRMEEALTSADLVSTAEAARQLGVDRSTLARWAGAGDVVPAQRTRGGHMRWDVDQLRTQLEALGVISPKGSG